MIGNAVGYGGFRSYGNLPYSSYKPGQKSLDRDYYSKATLENPNGKTVLANFGRFDSIYNENVAQTVKPSDFKVRVAGNSMQSYEFSHNPELFQHTKAGKQEAFKQAVQGGATTGAQGAANTFLSAGATQMGLTQTGGEQGPNTTLYKATSHWKSSYNGVVEDNQAKAPSKSERPLWSLPRQAYTSKRSYFQTEYGKSMGTYGHNPRSKLNQDHEKMENENHELTVGTTKVTKHIPGYNGFLPKTDLNPNAVLQGQCDKPRETFIKQNIVENYSVKIPGYSGHMPMSVLNDRGNLRPKCFGTDGETFH